MHVPTNCLLDSMQQCPLVRTSIKILIELEPRSIGFAFEAKFNLTVFGRSKCLFCPQCIAW